MGFIESPRFPENISLGVTGGPAFSSSVIVLDSGREQRNENWDGSRCEYNAAHGVKNQSDLNDLIKFFRACRGRVHGFRFKDWSDYTTVLSTGLIGSGHGNGHANYQLNKYYMVGSLYELRSIVKPVAGTLSVYLDSILLLPTKYSINTATGRISMDPVSTAAAITGITKANPGVVTCGAAHSLLDNEICYITDVVGMTEVNTNHYKIQLIDTTRFELHDEYTDAPINTTTFGTYVSGGLVRRYPQASMDINWIGEFDVPCRFDTDKMAVTAVFPTWYDWAQIPIIEISPEEFME